MSASFSDHLLTALVLTLPLVVAGVAHMAVVRFDLLASLKIPIDERRFGANKTWRGVLFMPAATILGVYLTLPVADSLAAMQVDLRVAHPAILGIWLGLAYVLAELPNSYVKRRLGIAPGKLPEKKRALFAVMDQADSAIGCVIAYALLTGLPVIVAIILILLGPAVHLVANVSLYMAGLRNEPL